MLPRGARPLVLLALMGPASCHPASGVARPAGPASQAVRRGAPLAAANERALAAVPQPFGRHDTDCAASGESALGLLVRSVDARPCSSEEGKVKAEWRLALAWVRPGSAIEKIDGAAGLDARLEENISCHAVDDERRISLAAAADLDGDGAPEVVLVSSSQGEESLDTWRTSIWTVRGGRAERYRHDPGLAEVMSDPSQGGA